MQPWYWHVAYFLTFVPLSVIFTAILVIEAGLFAIFIRPLRAVVQSVVGTAGHATVTRLLCMAYMTDENASARHRLYKVRDFLFPQVSMTICPPTSVASYKRFFLPWKRPGHYCYFVILFLNRFLALLRAPAYDVVFLQREIISEFFLDPPFFIFLLWLLNPNIVYDVDDAIWMIPPHSVRTKSFWQKKMAALRFACNVRFSKVTIVSNDYLKREALKYNDQVAVIPTLIDIDDYPEAIHRERKPVIVGWIGGPGNLSYLKLIEKPLSALSRRYALRLKIISSRTIQLNGVDTVFVPWAKRSASREIATFDIGVMPLTLNSYTQGKAGFKILEYMAAGIPTVASNVGVNSEIISEGKTGFLADTDEAWESVLAQLIDNFPLRQSIGHQARLFVAGHYDYRCWINNYTDILSKIQVP